MNEQSEKRLETAADWVILTRAGTLSRSESVELDLWLEKPENLNDFHDALNTWDLMDHLSGTEELDRLKSDKPQLAVPVAVARPAWSWAIAASLVFALGLSVFISTNIGPSVYSTELGQQRVVELEDGTVVHLDTDTQIQVTYSDSQRRIELERGRALFDVAREINRPFTVSAGEVQVTALGTQFDVFRRERSTEVAVVEGKVSLQMGSSSVQDPIQDLESGQQHLVRGQQASVSTSTRDIDVHDVDIKSVLVWTTGKIELNLTPLPEAIDAFNRYSRHKMKLADASLSTIRVSGLFDFHEIEEFRASLTQSAPVKTFRTTGGTILITSDAQATAR